MVGILWSLLGVVSGSFVALQAPINAQLARGLGMPVAAAAISFLTGAVILAIITAIMMQGQGQAINWRAPAPWLFIAGGVLGAFYVTCSIFLVTRLGAASTMAFIMAGQLLAGIVIDRIGIFGLAVREISLGRIAGAILLLSGALLIRTT
ncbi:DMT family transporter [Limoniibacter endophyticus]|uniref:Transporter family-2 protein n=1 Tax=Limoniibacter endophyticus TaxID=1565040 RepID=A0A8J3DLD1_9HYPH|nr:DMT family transporter [Limoniibacter endophyticus]GHC61207.1 hypothetical protein GCM10010136_01640 [Limoniibacter endophyticus]